MKKACSLLSTKTPFMNLFTYSEKQYDFLKVDILTGIYVDQDGEISIRPTPGVFLQSIASPDDPQKPFGEIFFIPGIFNPISNGKCKFNTLFTPGVFGPSVDCYSFKNLEADPTSYLNKFIPMKMPFNINGFLSPTSNLSVGTNVNRGIDPSNLNLISYPLLTPLDFNSNDNLALITQNNKFMTNLFSPDSLNKVIKEQKPLDRMNLAATQIISSPSALSMSNKQLYNYQCLKYVPGKIPIRYYPQGVQFYTILTPKEGVGMVPFILYDSNGMPISSVIVQTAIVQYCKAYQSNYFFYGNFN